jgi:hypothetical protein
MYVHIQAAKYVDVMYVHSTPGKYYASNLEVYPRYQEYTTTTITQKNQRKTTCPTLLGARQGLSAVVGWGTTAEADRATTWVGKNAEYFERDKIRVSIKSLTAREGHTRNSVESFSQGHKGRR